MQLNLEAEGFATAIVGDGLEAIKSIEQDSPDLVLLDVMLPGASGFEVCDRVRSSGNRVPILFLTARGREDDRVRGLELGGDDYITKPFSIRELLQRIRAMLRRQQWYESSPHQGGTVEFGGNVVSFAAYQAKTWSGATVTLTQKECMVLKLLVEHQGEVVDRDTILDKVWGYDRYPSSRTIDNLVLQLRRYFEKNPRHPVHITTQYGAGYRFMGDRGE